MPLTAEQQAPVNAVATTRSGHALLVIAGPGSGKTSTLVAAVRAALAAGAVPSRIQAISFTNNSAAELKVRLHRAAGEASADTPRCPALDQVSVSTFHSWVARLDAQRIQPWTYAPVRLGKASFALALHLYNPNAATHTFSPAEIAAAERHLEGSELFDDMWARNFNQVASADGINCAGFEALKRATADLKAKIDRLQLCTHGTLMAAGATLANTLRTDSLDWVFIDEAQDLNRPQHAFIRALQNRTGCRVFAIADDDQGIYKFRGASSAFLKDLEKRAADTPSTAKKFLLTQNFRSTAPIVQLSRQWITPNWNGSNRGPKTLFSSRTANVLPVVILAATGRDGATNRGRHAGTILQAARDRGLLGNLGEAAALSFSPRYEPEELTASGLPLNTCAEPELPGAVFEEFLKLCRQQPARMGDWHHTLWNDVLVFVKANYPDGVEGLEDVYACVEVFRRVAPKCNSHLAADAIKAALRDIGFFGERPDPDYAGDAINQLSLHASKGLEFRAVWLLGNDYSFATRPQDEQNGQPNLLGELGELFVWGAQQIARVAGQTRAAPQHDKAALADANHRAIALENRRLLYVGISRAADLLLVSAPYTEAIAPKWAKRTQTRCKQENAFRDAIQTAAKLAGAAHVVIETDAEARAFAATLSAAYRHPSWQPPVRHRVESFTSLTRQLLPGEERVVELPPAGYLPGPQTDAAITGDHFHRIMHLLALDPDLLASRLAGRVSDRDLVARVSHRPQSAVEALLASFFADTTHRPWTWFDGAHTEVPFNGFIPDPQSPGSDILLKGFLDLQQTGRVSKATLRLVDWKSGLPTHPDARPGGKHEQQLLAYASALQLVPATVELLNYYPATKTCIRRPAPPAASAAAAATQTAAAIVASTSSASRSALAPVAAPQLAVAHNPTTTALAILAQCRPHCPLRRGTGMYSAPITVIAGALKMTASELESALTPLQLPRLHQNTITPQTPRPFIGISKSAAAWLNF